MIDPRWKKVVLAGFAIVLIAVIFYFKADSIKKAPSRFINPAFAEYVSAYTTGTIPSGAMLAIEFTKDMVDSSAVGNPVSEKFFDFAPAITGKRFYFASDGQICCSV